MTNQEKFEKVERLLEQTIEILKSTNTKGFIEDTIQSIEEAIYELHKEMK